MFFVPVMHLHGEVVRLRDRKFTLLRHTVLTLSLKCSLFLLCTSMVKWTDLQKKR